MASSRRRQDGVEGERQRIGGARRFWASREQAAREGDDVWASIYCTIRDRRRTKSHSSLPPTRASWSARTPSTEPEGGDAGTGSTSTSGGKAPTRRPLRSKSMDMLTVHQAAVNAEVEVVSARSYQTTCHLAMKPVPVRFSSSVRVHLGSTRRSFTEQVTFQMRLVPLSFSETLRVPRGNGCVATRERFV